MILVFKIALGIILAPILLAVIVLLFRYVALPVLKFFGMFFGLYLAGLLSLVFLGYGIKYSEKLYLAMGFDDYGFPLVMVAEFIALIAAGATVHAYRKELSEWFMKKFMPKRFATMKAIQNAAKNPWPYSY